MPFGSLDHIYRSILLSKYFVKGWGKPENLKRLFAFRKVVSNREVCYKLIPKDYPITIDKDEKWSDCRVLEGRFRSPLDIHLPGLLPEEVRQSHFQILLPDKWKEENYKPVCLHFAGTGDHYFWKRRHFMCKPLLREAGIGAIILENPFYGSRKPKDQVRSNLHNVSDIFVMGGCLMLEALVLFNWCEQQGFGPLGVTGLSMGGHMASLAATNWPKPLVIVPCLSWSSASAVFTRGVMSDAIPWDVLENQYFSDDVYREEIRKMVTIIDDDAFRAGQHFVQNYSQGFDKMERIKIPDHGATDEPIKSTDKPLKESHPQTHISQTADKCPLMAEETGSSDMSSVNDLAKSLAEMSSSIEKKEESQLDDASKKKQIGMGILSSLAESKFKLLNFRVKSSKQQTKEVKRELADYQMRKAYLGNGELACDRLSDRVLQDELPGSVNPNSTDKKVVGRKLPFSLLGISPAQMRDREALQFMCGIMDECTHLKNFSVPVDTSLIIAICATEDGYVPREGVTHLIDIWPDAEVRYVKTGHVGAYLLHQAEFRTAIKDAFLRAKQKYPRK